MSRDLKKEPWRPGERPDETPTHPYDPMDPDPSPAPNPVPIPPDEEPAAPVREPTTPMPMTDPEPPEPTRLSRKLVTDLSA
ncbi:MAG: hypothetical protein H0W34_13385, partial [Pyrinomonadaceae bacterium]|nr:hypothetical protein [Pyrinomonadaceae bacterium]